MNTLRSWVRRGIRPFRNGAGDPAGYTLVETAFAMVFLAIGLLAVAQMIPLAGQHLTSSRNFTEAEELAQAVLEELKAAPFDDPALVAGTHTFTIDGRTFEYLVTDNTPVPGTKRVDLNVSWAEARGTKTLDFTTILNQ